MTADNVPQIRNELKDEAERFRITAWPDRTAAPTQFARPRLVGVASPSEITAPGGFGLEVLDAIPPLRDPNWPRDGLAGDALYSRFHLAPELIALLDDPRGEELVSWLHSTDSDVRRFSAWKRPQPRVDFLLFDLDQAVTTPLSDEMFMRELLAVDSSNPLAVAEATMAWGPVSAPIDETRTGWNDPGGFVTARPPSSASYLDREVITNVETAVYTVERQDSFDTHWDLIRQRYLYEFGHSLWIPDSPRSEREPTRGKTLMVLPVLEYSRYRFPAVQALMESWAVRQGAVYDTSTDVATPDLSGPWTQRRLPPPASELDALDTMVRSLNNYLSGLGPHLSLHGEQIWWQPMPRLTAAMFLQVHAFVSEGLPARRCANETCQQWFTRQRGRSQHGQRRTTGVLYCSSSCAKAQSQREYRRRKRR
jgi:hypothetical protein